MNQFPPVRSSTQKRLLCIATKLYSWRRPVRAPSTPPKNPLAVVCVSDTHNTTPVLPPGDVLLHAGDLTESGTFTELQDQLDWLNAQPHQHKVVIGGNHDLVLDSSITLTDPQKDATRLNWGSIVYLQDRSVELSFANGRSLTVYGSPWTPKFGQWAFQYPATTDIWANKVPANVDVLLTHGPPRFHLDKNEYGGMTGCSYLANEIYRARPRLVVAGHIHESYGEKWAAFDAVQRLWETFLCAKGGWWELCQLARLVLLQRLMGHAEEAHPVHLVNAAAVGGRGNSERRLPITVAV